MWTTFYDSATQGPILLNADGVLTAADLTLHPEKIADFINPQLKAAQEGLPEGSQVELTIYGWSVLGLKRAQWVAGKINDAYAQGNIQSPTDEPLKTWPSMNGALATGDDESGVVIIRWVKEFAWLVPIIVLLVGILAGAALVYLLGRNSASGRYLPPSGQTSGQSQSPLDWALRHWQWIVLGAAALAVAPFVVRHLAQLREAEREYERAEEGE